MRERTVNGKTTEAPSTRPMTVICAWCTRQERIGDTWGPLCSYLDSQEASHGICPTCFAKQQAKLAHRRNEAPQ